MPIFDSPWALSLSGLLCGMFIGAVARHSHFCTLNALERHWYAGDSRGLRAWILAATVAMISTQLLMATNIAPAQDNFYLGTTLNLLGAIIGGLMFGIGMALVGTCSFGALVRLGGGSLKSLIVIGVIGFAALATQRGVLGQLRFQMENAFAVDFSWAGSQSIGDIASALTGIPLNMPVIVLCALLALIWVFKSEEFRSSTKHIFAGIAIGFGVSFGWLVTSFFQKITFAPVQLESASFVMPPGDVLLWIAADTGSFPDYGMGLVFGVVAGAAIVAKLSDNVQWEACDSAHELSRHLCGAILMGVGGVLALGCTIGQGVSAMSMLALSAPIAFASIVLGARMGLSYIMGGLPEIFGSQRKV